MSGIQTEYSIKNEYQYPEEENSVMSSYIDNRLLAQIEWYDRKSALYQKNYKRFTSITFLLSACIPIFSLLLDLGLAIKLIVVALSSSITIITSIMSLYNYKDLWIQYRSNCEILKSVLHRYKTKTGEFCSKSNQANFKLLVSSCEEYMTNEFKCWGLLYDKQDYSSTGS